MQTDDTAGVVIGELGPVRVWIDGEELTVSGEKRTAVLSLLALRGRNGATLDYLTDTVWNAAASTARTALTTTILRLRKQLGEDSILTDGPRYRLGPDVSSHRERFLGLVNAATTQHNDPAAVLAVASEARSLWRGDPWVGLDDLAPLLADRVMLRDAHLRMLEATARAARAVGDRRLQTATLRQLIAARPYHEGWWHDLAITLADEGDRTAGLRLLQDARAALDQVGLLPGPDLIQLEQQLVGTTTATVATAASDRTDRRGKPTLRVAEVLPFVGRNAEIARLTQANDIDLSSDHALAVLRPTHGLAVVEGPAGTGKSRLMVETARRCTDHVCLSGRCAQSTDSLLGPFRQILDEYLSATDPVDAASDTRGFERVLGPHATGLAALAGATGIGDHEAAEDLVHAVVTVLLRSSSRIPHLLLLDDLQWASAVVLDIVEGLADRSSPGELTLIASCRLDRSMSADQARLAELMAGPTAEHLQLGLLTQVDLEAIIESTGSTATTDELHERTGGNPFFVDQVLRSHAHASDDRALLRLVWTRVALVHDKAGPFLTAAALIGLDFDSALAAAVCELDPARTDAVVDALVDNGLLLRIDDAGTRCSFAHGLVAEAMHSETPTSDRRRLHLAIANQQQGAGAPARDWIRHLVEAGPLVDPHTLALVGDQAAGQLLRRGQASTAIEILQAILERPLGPADRVSMLTWKGTALFARGDDEPGLPLLEASEIALEHDLDRALINVALAYGQVGPWLSNSDPNGPRLLRLALDRCAADRPDLRVRIESRLACFDIFTGALKDRVAAADRAVALAESTGDPGALGDALNTSMIATTCPANLEQTRRIEADLLRLERAGQARSEILNRPAISTFWMADGAQFRSDIADRRIGADASTRRDYLALNGLETVLAIFDDDLVTARARLSNQQLVTDVERGNHAWKSVLIEWLEGAPERALATVKGTYDDFRGAPLRYTLLWLATEAGEEQLAAELYETITAKRVQRTPEVMLGGYALAGLAMTAHLRSDHELTELVWPVLQPLAGQMLGVPWSGFPAADFFLALLAGVRGDARAQRDLTTSARRLHDQMTAPSFNRLVDRYLV